MTPEDHVDAHRRAGRHLVAAGIRSFALDQGDGPPVLCLHGVPVSSYVYRKVVLALAEEGLRGIAVDLPGLGLAERPPEADLTWTGLGRWTAAAVDALDLDRVHLVVHDIGGPVGVEAIGHLGDRVASLTLLNTITDPARFTPPPVMRPFTVPVVDRLYLAATPDVAFVRLMRVMGLADQRASSDAELAAHRHLLVRDDGGRAFLRIMKGFEQTTEKSAAHRAAIRSVPHRQVVWGEQDRALPVDTLGRTAAEVAGVPGITRLPARHFLQEDQPVPIARAVASLVRAAA